MNIRNEREALSIAVEMEKRACKTYERAKMMLPTEEMIEAVNDILQDESRHVVRFQAMLDKAGAGQVDASLVSAMAGVALFPGGVMNMHREAAFRSVMDLYKFAAQSEREAVEFYTACADKCESADIAAAFLSIAGEESMHLITLEKTLEKMKAENK
ncbi:MAG: ferritin family protein [Clostridia bacterium]|nr:ferritin family protein [Clostridia bacterium]